MYIYIYISKWGGCPNGIFHPWVRWDRGWRSSEILPPSPSPPPKSGCLVIIVSLHFLTHSRDLDVLAWAYCREFRYGTVTFSYNKVLLSKKRVIFWKIILSMGGKWALGHGPPWAHSAARPLSGPPSARRATPRGPGPWPRPGPGAQIWMVWIQYMKIIRYIKYLNIF